MFRTFEIRALTTPENCCATVWKGQTKTSPCTLTGNQKQDEAVQRMLNSTKLRKNDEVTD